LNPEELQKRIDELKTVQFWLEQNARMLGTTIQALEVQRMTLSTLKTMNVQMADLRDSMKIAPASTLGAAAGSVAQGFGADALLQATRNAMDSIGALGKVGAAAPVTVAPAATAAPAAASAARPEPAPPANAAADAAAPVGASGIVDPMQWWGALTKQFTQLAAGAMKESAADAAKTFAGAMLKQGLDAVGETIAKAAPTPADVSRPPPSPARPAAGADAPASAPARPAPATKRAAARKTVPGKAAGKSTKTKATAAAAKTRAS